jgi:hypothetical protein
VVTTTTLLHQLAKPWQQSPGDEPYYFCNQPGCTVVYFTTSGRQFGAEALRQPVGQKSTAAGRTFCYCFDIRFSDLAHATAARQRRDFVIQKTRHKVCACEQRNPSGRCCLRDFPTEEE